MKIQGIVKSKGSNHYWLVELIKHEGKFLWRTIYSSYYKKLPNQVFLGECIELVGGDTDSEFGLNPYRFNGMRDLRQRLKKMEKS